MRFWRNKKQREALKKYKHYMGVSERCSKYARWAKERALKYYIEANPHKYDKR